MGLSALYTDEQLRRRAMAAAFRHDGEPACEDPPLARYVPHVCPLGHREKRMTTSFAKKCGSCGKPLRVAEGA